MRHSGVWTIRPAILVCFLAVASAAAAGPKEKAEELVRQGLDLRRRGDDLRALPLFQEAHRLSPTPRSAVQLGTVEQALGRWADAEEHIGEGLRSADDPWIRKNRAVIDEAMRSVKLHIASVEVTGDPAGAEVLVNGKKVGPLPLPGPIRVSAGSVDVEVNAPGYRRGFRTVNLPPGGYQTVVIRLEKIEEAAPPPPPPPGPGPGPGPTPPPPPAPWQRWAAIGAFGGAVVAAGVGTYEILKFNDGVHSFNRSCGDTPQGPVSKTTGAPDAGCAQQQSDYRNAKTVAIVGYSVAGVLAAGGLVLMLTAPDAPPSAEPKVSWACAPTLAHLGATCGLRF